MKKLISLMLIAWLTGPAALAWADGRKETPMKVKETPMKVKVGQSFQITVPDQAGSTGYATVVKSLPPGLVLISAETPDGKAPPAKSPGQAPRVGAAAAKVFTFVATEPMKGLLEINSARMWEKPLQWQHKNDDADAAKFFYRISATE